MRAFFFGPGNRQLFGYYSAAAGWGGRAAVLCPSWGPEYQYAHRAMRVAARRLADSGVHVLRFDPSGTGDSWGDGTACSLDRWVEDVGLAVEEVRAITGVARVDLVGFRLGAWVVASAAGGFREADRLVLWDPVLDGDAWVREWGGGTPVATGEGDTDGVDLARARVTRTLVQALRGIVPGRYAAAVTRPTLQIRTLAAAEGAGDEGDPLPGAEQQSVHDVAPWREDTSIWSGLVPARTIETMAEWMAGE